MESQVNFYVVAYEISPCPGGGGAYEYFDIGTLDAGEYNLTLYSVGPHTTFPVQANTNYSYLDQISFSVGVGSAAMVPTVNHVGLFILISIVLLWGIKLFDDKSKTWMNLK